MPAWSLTVAATQVASGLLPWRTKPPPNAEVLDFFWILDNSSYDFLFTEMYFGFWIRLLPVLHKTVNFLSTPTASNITIHALWSQDVLHSALMAWKIAFYSFPPLYPPPPPLFLLLLSSSSTPSHHPSSSTSTSLILFCNHILTHQTHALPTTWLTVPVILKRRWDFGLSSQFDRPGISLSNGKNLTSSQTANASQGNPQCGLWRGRPLSCLIWFWYVSISKHR